MFLDGEAGFLEGVFVRRAQREERVEGLELAEAVVGGGVAER